MTSTINISMPTKMYKQAKKLVAEGKYNSISELVRAGLRRTFEEADVVTENGLPGWREDRILESPYQAVKKEEVWETPDDIDKYFKKLRKEIEKRKKVYHGKNRADWQVQSVIR